jgi:hypothetical protein
MWLLGRAWCARQKVRRRQLLLSGSASPRRGIRVEHSHDGSVDAKVPSPEIVVYRTLTLVAHVPLSAGATSIDAHWSPVTLGQELRPGRGLSTRGVGLLRLTVHRRVRTRTSAEGCSRPACTVAVAAGPIEDENKEQHRGDENADRRHELSTRDEPSVGDAPSVPPGFGRRTRPLLPIDTLITLALRLAREPVLVGTVK